MSIIQNPVRKDADGDSVVQYIGVCNIASEVFTLSQTFNKLSIRNCSAGTLTLTVGTDTYNINPFSRLDYVNQYSQFTLSSTINSSEFEMISRYDKDDTLTRLDGLDSQLTDNTNQIRVNRTGSRIRVAWKYDSDTDMWIDFQPCGVNNLIQIGDIWKATNYKKYVDSDLSRTATLFHGKVSDWVGPYQVNANTNGDGDTPTSYNFTGGWHSYAGDQSMGVPVARNLSFSVKVNGVDVADGSTAAGNSVVITVVNRIQAYNTAKANGTGREVLEETVTYTVSQGKIQVDNTFKALESIFIAKYFGIQTCNNSYRESIRYHNSKDLATYGNPFTTASDAGNKTVALCRAFTISNGYDKIYAFIDPNVDLASLSGLDNVSNTAYTTTYGKSYFNLINGTGVGLLANATRQWRGGYKFFCTQ